MENPQDHQPLSLMFLQTMLLLLLPALLLPPVMLMLSALVLSPVLPFLAETAPNRELGMGARVISDRQWSANLKSCRLYWPKLTCPGDLRDLKYQRYHLVNLEVLIRRRPPLVLIAR
jgi:hypothetical protein